MGHAKNSLIQPRRTNQLFKPAFLPFLTYVGWSYSFETERSHVFKAYVAYVVRSTPGFVDVVCEKNKNGKLSCEGGCIYSKQQTKADNANTGFAQNHQCHSFGGRHQNHFTPQCQQRLPALPKQHSGQKRPARHQVHQPPNRRILSPRLIPGDFIFLLLCLFWHL